MENKNIDPDSVKLLEECNKGVKMGISSINHVMEYVSSNELKNLLEEYKEKHQDLESSIANQIIGFEDKVKDPCPLTEAMSMIMTNAKMLAKDRDSKIAELMHDGCNMGIKSISKYLNKYPTSNKDCIELAKDIIKIEDEFLFELRKYL